jgi:hypothetical protein
MGVSCTIRGWDKTKHPAKPQDWCRFEVVDGKVVGTDLAGRTGLALDIMALDPLKAMPGVRIPLSDAEAWVKALPWYYRGDEMAGVMDDGSIPPMPGAPVEVSAAPVETAEQAVQTS